MKDLWSGRAGAWRRTWWIGGAGWLRRRSALLGAAWADGFYMNAWPAAGLLLPALSLLAGFGFGIAHPSFLALQPPVASFAQSLPLLVLTVLLGGLGAHYGLLVAAGYALGEILTPVPLGYPPTTLLDFLARREGPRLIGDLLLLLLAIQPTLAARGLAGSAESLLARFGAFAGKASLLLTVLLQAALVWLWVHAAPMAMRLPWLWIKLMPAITFFDFWAFARFLPLLAAGAVLLRALLTGLARRRGSGLDPGFGPGLGPLAGQLLAALAEADLNPAWPRRLPPVAGQLAAALVTVAFLLGLIVSWTRGLSAAAIVVALYLARLYLLPRLPGWNAAMRRTPLLLRWLGGLVFTFALASGWMALPWSDVGRNADWGSFGAELSGVGVALAATLALFPLAGDKKPVAGH